MLAMNYSTGVDNAASSDRVPALARVMLWSIPTFAAIGGLLYSVDIGSVPIYPFKVVLPLALVLTIAVGSLEGPVRRETWLLCALVAWSAVGTLWANDPGGALQASSVFMFAAVLVFTLHTWWDRWGNAVVQDLIAGWRVALVISGLVAVWELGTGSHLATQFVVDRAGQVDGVVLSLFNNPNDYGAFLAIAICISLYPVSGRIPVWVGTVAAFSTVLLVMSGSRFALGAMVVAGGIVMVRLRHKWWPAPSAWMLMGGGIVGFALLAATGSKLAEKMLALTQPGAFGDTSAGSRLALVANGIWSTVSTGGLGVGGGGFERMIRYGHPPAHVRGDVVNPHNMWVELTAEQGVLGLALFLFLLVTVWGRLTGRKKPPEPAATVLWASLGAYIVAVCTPSAYVSSPVNWMFLATASVASLGLGRTRPPTGLLQPDGLLPLPVLRPLGRPPTAPNSDAVESVHR